MSSPEPKAPTVAVEINVTPSFVADFGELKRQIGPEASRVIYDQFFSALEAIKNQTPQDKLPITPYGLFGDSFQYSLNSNYVFTFKRVTDRESEGRPLVFHYFLKNLFRKNK